MQETELITCIKFHIKITQKRGQCGEMTQKVYAHVNKKKSLSTPSSTQIFGDLPVCLYLYYKKNTGSFPSNCVKIDHLQGQKYITRSKSLPLIVFSIHF
jgi:hypothetical protein